MQGYPRILTSILIRFRVKRFSVLHSSDFNPWMSILSKIFAIGCILKLVFLCKLRKGFLIFKCFLFQEMYRQMEAGRALSNLYPLDNSQKSTRTKLNHLHTCLWSYIRLTVTYLLSKTSALFSLLYIYLILLLIWGFRVV